MKETLIRSETKSFINMFHNAMFEIHNQKALPAEDAPYVSMPPVTLACISV